MPPEGAENASNGAFPAQFVAETDPARKMTPDGIENAPNGSFQAQVVADKLFQREGVPPACLPACGLPCGLRIAHGFADTDGLQGCGKL